ncbi:MAG: phosphoglycerate mutase family protein [Deltaproteobacteria bacterium]|nr:phosphoglycerate mutase family protein [Deltaproteobacteria bacterium]
MKTIYFIRHTQSEANLKDILASRHDFPLTEKGAAGSCRDCLRI